MGWDASGYGGESATRVRVRDAHISLRPYLVYDDMGRLSKEGRCGKRYEDETKSKGRD